jgi:tetratricopeptide (TPR) repeat protein
VTSAMMALTTFLVDYFPYPLFFLFLWSLLIFIITTTWIFNRTVFPKSSKDKINLIIGITTEDETQKVRITKDTADQIEKLLIKHNLSNRYQVKVLHNHLAKKLSEKIKLYSESMKAGFADSEDMRKFNHVSDRMNAKFFVYGDLIKRDSPNGQYLLSFEALIKHAQPTTEQGKILRDEFNQLWTNEVRILESDELNGFRSNAEHLFFTASFMLGLATFVDNQFLEGISIWKELENHVKRKEDLKKHLPKITELKSISYFLQSRLDYFAGNMERSMEFREKVLDITSNNYDSHLTQAIKEVSLRDRPDLALQHISKAKELSKGDGTWKYSKFYLEIKLNDQEEALKTLDDIIGNSFTNEVDTIHQVIAYNHNCLQKDSKHVQTHFIIGAFLYKKLSNPVAAYEQFEKFIECCQGNEQFNQLVQRAKSYINEIDPILGIEKK